MGADAQVEPYDCVLMDLEMPVMDGYTAARAVREEEAVGKLRASNIVALSKSRPARMRDRRGGRG